MKRGQVNINFGMIFSIILIIAFISVAVFAISKFLVIKRCSETGLFKQDLQDSIDRAWDSEESSINFNINLPSNLDYVCFVDLVEGGRGEHSEKYEGLKRAGVENINMFFWPLKKACEGQEGYLIKHLDIEEITENNNPNCFRNNGEIRVEKGLYDSMVSLK
jgi:hypothetical protein